MHLFHRISRTGGNMSYELRRSHKHFDINESRTPHEWVINSIWVNHIRPLHSILALAVISTCMSHTHVGIKESRTSYGWVTNSVRVLPLVRSDISTTQYPALAEMWVTNSTCMSHKRVEINQLHMSWLRTPHEPYYSILVTFFKPFFTHDFSVICLSFHTHTCTHAHACVHTHAHTRRCLMKGGNKRPKTCLPLLNVLAGSKLYQETD